MASRTRELCHEADRSPYHRPNPALEAQNAAQHGRGGNVFGRRGNHRDGRRETVHLNHPPPSCMYHDLSVYPGTPSNTSVLESEHTSVSGTFSCWMGRSRTRSEIGPRDRDMNTELDVSGMRLRFDMLIMTHITVNMSQKGSLRE